ncbi:MULTISPECIES: glycosyltransferase [unclassified Massilia]|uniref:glycosyltransferase n=1 Tax=unclassified Massilia TaxID=2609279 RepID=UPI00177B0115|nr:MULTISPECIES: glycosyltransferase [unclassified Massilia]MBD8528495.1 glycosyltransferase [Massilia sp. CFBP 13647]MBD8671882.1 glycosyltransferase [Massilia sp. CFBP 13721]
MGNRPVAALAPAFAPPRLIAHVVNRLDAGGAGNGLLDLIAHMPGDRYRHVVLCLRDHALLHTHLREQGVEVIDLHKRDGPDPGHFLRMVRALRALRPDLVHTRNLGGLEGQLAAALAGVRLRVHGEYGRESGPGKERAGPGRKRAPGFLRRALRPLVGHYIAVSAEQERWLIEQVGAEPSRVSHISNGVDSLEFHPRLGPHAAVGPDGFMRDDAFVIGSVGRMDDAKNDTTLVEAFLRLISSPHAAHSRLRLLIVGDGPMRAECQAMLERAGAGARAWLPGERPDTAQLMRAMDLMVLPALAEGSGNVLLEAMATGLPVVATAVGVHKELVQPGLTGILVPPMSPDVMAAAIADYCRIPEMGARHGARARGQVIAHHSLPAMARSYLAVYDALAGG